VNCGPL